MSRFIFLVSICCTLSMSAQTANMNFETGDFTGWDIELGIRQDENTVDYDAGFFLDINDHVQMMTPAVPPLDEYGVICNTVEIPTVFPGGLFSARIGDLNGGRVASKVSRTFTVTENETYLLYSYAIILQEPGHSEEEQPKFIVNIRNKDGDIVTCGQFEAFAGPNAADQGFISCDLPRNYECDFPLTECSDAFPTSSNLIQILPWTSGGADLTTFLGEEITIEFIILDCLKGAHGATAYLEASVGDLTIGVDSFCQPTNGGALTLTAPLGFVSYLWAHSGETTQSVTIDTPVEGDTFTVDLTSNTGCNTSTDIVLEIKPDAAIDPIMNETICKGGSVTILPSGTNATSFYFSEIDFTGTSVVLSPEVTTTYTVFALNENGCRGASTTFQIEVLDFGGPLFPEAIFELEPVVDASGTCSTVNFNNLSSYCKGGLTYEWDFGDGSPVSTEENPTHTYPNTATQESYAITLVITAADGETATANDTFHSQGTAPSFDVVPPDCAFVQVVNTSVFCGGEFTDVSFFTYSWDFGDGTPLVVTDETQSQIEHTYTTSGAFTITQTMTNINTGISFTVSSNPIEVTAALDADFEYTTDTCLSVSFRDLSVFCAPIRSYVWDFGDGTQSTESSPTHIYTTVGPHIVKLTVNDGITDQEDTQVITLTPTNSVPDFSFVLACEDIRFTDTSTSCWDPITYSWDFGDGSPVSTEQNPIHTFEYGNTYTVTLTINDGIDTPAISQMIAVNRAFEYTPPQNLEACGIPGAIEAVFDFQTQTDLILENVASSVTIPPVVTYYTTQANAEASINPIPIEFKAREASQTLFARVQEALGCVTIFSFEVQVGRTPEVYTIEDIFLCLEQGTTSVYDLTQLNARFFTGLDQTNVVLTYHLSLEDATAAQNATQSVNLEAGVPVTVFVRAADETSLCYTLTEFIVRIDNRDTDETSICFLKVSNTMTPNGDGRNDNFMIANIAAFPANTVTIYNRWGNLVFRDSGYDNSWSGTFEGKPLPVGTYYYIVELHDDKNRKSSGYISILR